MFNRISEKTKWRLGLYVAFIVLFWFLGKAHTMKPATAFFGLAALTLVFEAGFWFVWTKILRKD